jgi:hypothetical protein
MHRITKVAAVAVTSLIAIGAGSAAHASATIDSAGKGFVGKGDVQTAFGWNNQKVQQNANSLAFSTSQALTQAMSSSAAQAGSQVGSQAGTQSGSQAGTQAGTLEMIETLSCFKNTGAPVQQTRHGLRDGERSGSRDGQRSASRDASRDGSRDGVRTGSRAGTLSGSLSYAVDYDARTRNQVNGFILKGFNGDPTTTWSPNVVWNAPTFGDWADADFGTWSFGEWASFGSWSFGEYTFGSYTFGDAVTWGAWDTDNTNAEPDVCLNNGTPAPNIDPNSIVHTLTEGAITDGDITDGDITEGVVTEGAITPGAITDGVVSYGTGQPGALSTGATTVYVTFGGVTKPV